MKKRSDGRYCKSIRDERTGKRVYFYAETEREIFKKILDYTARSERGRLFSEVADEWWSEKLEKITEGTKRGYSSAYKRAREAFGETPIKDIRPRDIEAHLRSLSRQQYTSKSIKNDKLVINLIFDTAVVEGDIQYNPCASITVPKGKASTPRTSASLKDEEIIKNTSDIWLMPFLALMTGMRKGECLALQWGDIDFDKNLITVSKSAEHIGSRAHIKDTKTEKGHRSIILLPKLREVLLKHPRTRSTDFILSEDGGCTPLSAKQYNRRLREYRERTGIECTAHQLRHSFATLCFEAGLPDKVVQYMIGHANISTTKDIYTDVRGNMLEKASNTLVEYIEKSQE
jgi:integrase